MKLEVYGAEQVAKNLKAAEKALIQAKTYKMRDAVNYVKNHIKRSKLSGTVLKRRDGLLRSAISSAVVTVGNKVSGRVYPRIGGKYPPYPGIHETGKTIRPKHAKMLKIPIDPAMQTLKGKKLYPRREELRMVGNSLVMKDSGKPMFKLVKSVRIPARPYMAPSARETEGQVVKILGEVIPITCKIGNGG